MRAGSGGGAHRTIQIEIIFCSPSAVLLLRFNNMTNKFSQKRSACFILIGLVLLLGQILVPSRPVQAQAGSAYDLIDAVNQLRADYGLPPYVVDGGLMASAQAHSEYQASIQTITHQRADGTSPADLGFTENIAGGMNLSVNYAVQSIWSDTAHMNTMVGISSGSVGAGVAEANGMVYYTLQVRRDSSGKQIPVQTFTPPEGSPIATGPTTTQEVVISVQTITPAADGSIIHQAQAGQTLWEIAIAYGKTVAELITLNLLDPSNQVIYEGQKIIVQAPYTPTVTPTITNTPLPPTRTPRPTFTPRPTRPTLTPAPTATPTKEPLLPSLKDLSRQQRVNLAISILAISGLGLALTLGMGLKNKP